MIRYFILIALILLTGAASGYYGRMSGQDEIIADLGVKREAYFSAKHKCESFGKGPCIIIGAQGFIPRSVLDLQSESHQQQNDHGNIRDSI